MAKRSTLALTSLTRTPGRALAVEVVAGDLVGTKVQTEDEALQIGSADVNHLVLRDETVSRFHLELSRHQEGVLVVDCGSTNGTYVGSVRVERAIVQLGATVRVGQTTLQVADGRVLELDLAEEPALGRLKGRSPGMRRLFSRIETAAKSDVSVLLIGESGTGKELVAKELHNRSARADRPFVTLDCASLTPTLVASELFGHERGAFTGATDRRIGAFERANGGTIFLDEVGELPEELQPMLLGVLERRSFTRLGGKDPIAVDVRLVSATHRDLRKEVNSGRFRLDLFYRMAVVRLNIPPLRERPEDLPLLIELFVREAGETRALEEILTPEALALFERYRWPGNVRELRNYVEATVAMGELPEFDRPPSDRPPPRVPAEAASGAQSSAEIRIPTALDLPYKEARSAVLRAFESQYLPHIVERAEGNVSRAARDNSMDRSHLLDLLRRHGLK